MRHSIFESVWKGFKFCGEHPSPKMTAARMCAVERNRVAGELDNPCRDSRGRLSPLVIADYQLITAIRTCLPTRKGSLIGEGAAWVKYGSFST